MRVALLSLENWDGVWRRNQHLVRALVEGGHVQTVTWIDPPWGGPQAPFEPLPGVTVVRPPIPRLPKSLGGLRELARSVTTLLPGDLDVIWINDPQTGARLQTPVPTVYDVTDDNRTFDLPARHRARIVRAEDALAERANVTTVCSVDLAALWQERYGITAHVVHNGVDLDAWAGAVAAPFDGPGPHLVYVGTQHAHRLDVPLTCSLTSVGAVHLVGPDSLDDASRASLVAAGVHLHGPVPAADVPGVMLGADVLVCPHLVNDFTLSLDAIKAYEYLTSGRPVVATPTSGFQHLTDAAGVKVVDPSDFLAASSAPSDAPARATSQWSWANRAAHFAMALTAAELRQLL